jgi:hypothetical protein
MDQATKERVQQALDDIKSAPTDAPISIRAYERKHGFTRGYLQRRLNNQVAKFVRNGPAPILVHTFVVSLRPLTRMMEQAKNLSYVDLMTFE